MSRDMSGRFEPIYKAIVEPAGAPGPAGLTVYRFPDRSGYVEEQLVTAARGDGTHFVARCLTGAAAAQSLAPCERDVHAGDGLSVTFRFPAELLADWQALDAAVIRKVGEFLRTAG